MNKQTNSSGALPKVAWWAQAKAHHSSIQELNQILDRHKSTIGPLLNKETRNEVDLAFIEMYVGLTLVRKKHLEELKICVERLESKKRGRPPKGTAENKYKVQALQKLIKQIFGPHQRKRGRPAIYGEEDITATYKSITMIEEELNGGTGQGLLKDAFEVYIKRSLQPGESYTRAIEQRLPKVKGKYYRGKNLLKEFKNSK